MKAFQSAQHAVGFAVYRALQQAVTFRAFLSSPAAATTSSVTEPVFSKHCFPLNWIVPCFFSSVTRSFICCSDVRHSSHLRMIDFQSRGAVVLQTSVFRGLRNFKRDVHTLTLQSVLGDLVRCDTTGTSLQSYCARSNLIFLVDDACSHRVVDFGRCAVANGVVVGLVNNIARCNVAIVSFCAGITRLAIKRQSRCAVSAGQRLPNQTP